MHSSPFLLYTLLSREFYENIDRYEPSGEYRSAVEAELPEQWSCEPGAFWTYVTPSAWSGTEYGWKIHLSATVFNALETLTIATRILQSAGVAFKFCSDKRMLDLSLSKIWPRSQTGKFITVYPRSEAESGDLMERLDSATSHLIGPHILTDRAFRSSRVVHYRYGAHASHAQVDPYGQYNSGYYLDNGEWRTDSRAPHFSLPDGVSDPFSERKVVTVAVPKEVVLSGRYEIKGALKFNANGGIYFGVDRTTGKEVVVREERGALGLLDYEVPNDPAFILRREARILQKLGDTGYVPAFVDLFREWNNWFLVVERLDATSLWGHSMEFYFSSEEQTASFGLGKIISTIELLAEGLLVIHQKGIVLRDLTRNNVMFTRADGLVKFIDLEFAYELEDTGPWVDSWTPGYASAELAASERPTVEDDLYAFGVLIIDMLTFSAAGLDLDRSSILAKLDMVLADLGLPTELRAIVDGLTDSTPSMRWRLDKVIAVARELNASSAQRPMLPTREQMLEVSPPSLADRERVAEMEQSMLSYLDHVGDLNRKDRIWPASAEMFFTNPVSLQYGATGVAWFMLRSRGTVDPHILDWIEAKAEDLQLPPGLYSGTTGIALLLAEAGRGERASRLLDGIGPSSFENSSLYYGLAGWGLAQLRLWLAHGQGKYLDAAIEAGDLLVSRANHESTGSYWPFDNKTFLGLGDGQSGTALFLVYLAAVTGSVKYQALAKRALDYDLAHVRKVAGRMVWGTHVGASGGSPNLPHTRFGSAGIGAVSLRYYALTGDARYRDIALDCAHAVRSRISNKIWQDEGGSGFGEFFLDLSHFLQDIRFADVAHYHAKAVMCHAIKRPTGAAFGGVDHFRICCDYAAGAAGIGIFLNRLNTGVDRFLMPDQLLSKAVGLGKNDAELGEALLLPFKA